VFIAADNFNSSQFAFRGQTGFFYMFLPISPEPLQRQAGQRRKNEKECQVSYG
jgi:hypothetical protein